jgi:hypothetical protein
MKKSNSATTGKHRVVRGSFRDPAGFVFRASNGELRRQVSTTGAEDFEHFLSSGLYETLTGSTQLVTHEPLSPRHGATPSAHTVIKPTVVPYITYPFEWSFSQLQDAALLTLDIQKQALKHNMSLKDASAYNVQFMNGQPIFIDTLSFEKYTPGAPWQAYRQFCQHFLAPLALMAYSDLSLLQLMRVHLDGIPLELAVKLLPRKARLKPSLMMHLVLHARAQKAKAGTHERSDKQLKQSGLEAILDNLERTIRRLKPLRTSTEWADYYEGNTNYTADAADNKATLVRQFARPLQAKTALDLGGNDGRYSRVLNKLGLSTVCTDIDPNAVEANYNHIKAHHETAMLPLVIDLTNPGGALGWHNLEREPIHERLQCDLVLALAIIHHLVISNNLPFASVAEYFSTFAPYLIIEFVPKEDSQVQKLLATRKNTFPGYTEPAFTQAFEQYYHPEQSKHIPHTKRTLYLYKRK